MWVASLDSAAQGAKSSLGFLIRHCGWSTVPTQGRAHCSLFLRSAKSHPQPCLPKNIAELKSKSKGVWGLRMLEAGGLLPVPHALSPFLRDFSLPLHRTSFSENKNLISAILCSSPFLSGGTWLECPLGCLCHSLGSLTFWPLCVIPFCVDLSVLFFNRQPSGLTSCQKPCTWKTVR